MRLPQLLLAIAASVAFARRPLAGFEYSLETRPPPLIEIGESYILGQSSNASFGSALEDSQCGQDRPCVDGSCCNSDGQCGYKDFHCNPKAPAKCISNCNAKAYCGVDSKDGKATCPLNGCCSFWGFCGFTDTFCTNKESEPCQKDFGRCEVAPKPSCGKNSNTASNGRRVAYYQGWNVRARDCDKVWPNQINTTGLTHLVFAFASIDDKTFKIKPDDDLDIETYRQFTELRNDKLQTWIAVGGWVFSDRTSSTFHTWSDMAGKQENRAVFVKSVVEFFEKYGFQGIDIDWEFPVSADRGGNEDDTKNMIALMRDLREAFGNRYGLSTVLPADYGFLKNIDPLGMAVYLDHINFMSYDLHGPWEVNSTSVKPKIRPHTGLSEIENALMPLWFNKLNPAKINLGIAHYGRGFTASSKCLSLGCDFFGAGQKGDCSKQDGIMSNREIHRLISSKGLKPELLQDEAVKQITWDDQWWSYDDEETTSLKVAFANDRCLGGTFVWSVDYDSSSGSEGPPGSPQPSGSKSVSPTSEPASSDLASTVVSSQGGTPSSGTPPPATSDATSGITSGGSSFQTLVSSIASSQAGSSRPADGPSSGPSSTNDGSSSTSGGPTSPNGSSTPSASSITSGGNAPASSSISGSTPQTDAHSSNAATTSEGQGSSVVSSALSVSDSVSPSATSNSGTSEASSGAESTSQAIVVPPWWPTNFPTPTTSFAFPSEWLTIPKPPSGSLSWPVGLPSPSNLPLSWSMIPAPAPSKVSTIIVPPWWPSNFPKPTTPFSWDKSWLSMTTPPPGSLLWPSGLPTLSSLPPAWTQLPQHSDIPSAAPSPSFGTTTIPAAPSGGFEFEEFIDPDVWLSDQPELNCEPPCVIVPPPFELPEKTTITWPRLTTTLLSIEGGSTRTFTKDGKVLCSVEGAKFKAVTTTFDVAPITTDAIEFHEVVIGTQDSSEIKFRIVPSVAPPTFEVRLGQGLITAPPSRYIEGTAAPTPTEILCPGGDKTVIIAPMATIPIPLPTDGPLPLPDKPCSDSCPNHYPETAVYRKGPNKKKCQKKCGKGRKKKCPLWGCINFDINIEFPGWPVISGPEFPECGLFGCNGGCALFGCGGLCSPSRCHGIQGISGSKCPLCIPCPLGLCGGPGCTNGGCDPKGRDYPISPSLEDPRQRCEEKDVKTVTNYLASCTRPNPTSTSCNVKPWAVRTACGAVGITSTTWKGCGKDDQSTLTNVLVSCTQFGSSSSSCTTQAAGTITGCDITATASTTSNGPTCTKGSLSLDDDQGDDEGEPAKPKPSLSVMPSATMSAPNSKPTGPSVVVPPVGPKPSPITNAWRIRIYQWMEGKSSAVWWTLLDSNGDEAGDGQGSPITSNKRSGDQPGLEFGIDMSVRNEGNIENVDITFQYNKKFRGGCKVTWSTGTSKGGPKVIGCQDALPNYDYGCDDLHLVEWNPKNAGFERHFECFFKA